MGRPIFVAGLHDDTHVVDLVDEEAPVGCVLREQRYELLPKLPYFESFSFSSTFRPSLPEDMLFL